MAINSLTRICPANIPQHIIQRGNNRPVCFAEKQNFEAYIGWLKIYAKKYQVEVHVWVLVTNHVHLLCTPKQEKSISQMMQSLGRCYVRYFNNAYQRTGTLWDGRFKACLVEAEAYLLQLYRYIELNPVRAGMVVQPADYYWSSLTLTQLFYGSEFTGLHQSTTLISLAFVSASNQGFYAEFTDYARHQCDPWIEQNVIASTCWLSQPECAPFVTDKAGLCECLGNTAQVREALTRWFTQFERIEIWADCLAYDWVLLCELFGGAKQLPKNIDYMPFDLVTLFKVKGVDPGTEREVFAQVADAGAVKHNALSDARVVMACYQRLSSI